MNEQDEQTTEQTDEQRAQIWAELASEDTDEPSSKHVDADVAVEAAETPKAAAPAAAAVPAAKPADEATQLLDRIAGLEQLVGQQAGRLRKAEGHIGGLNGELERLRGASKAAGVDTPTTAQIEQAAGDDEAMKTLMEDYPEFGSALDKTLASRDQKLLKQLTAQATSAAPSGVSKEELIATVNDSFVESFHEGYKDVISSPQFAGWYARQEQAMKDLGASAKPRDAIKVLDAYKRDTQAPPPAPDKTKKLESAAALSTGRSGAPMRTKPESEMTREELWNQIAAEDA